MKQATEQYESIMDDVVGTLAVLAIGGLVVAGLADAVTGPFAAAVLLIASPLIAFSPFMRRSVSLEADALVVKRFGRSVTLLKRSITRLEVKESVIHVTSGQETLEIKPRAYWGGSRLRDDLHAWLHDAAGAERGLGAA